MDQAFPGSGSSLATDLYLTECGGRTATEALDDGVDPQRVWIAFCQEMGAGEEFYFLHRFDEKQRSQRRIV